MTMPTVQEAQRLYDDMEQLSLDASEAVDRVRTQVALGQAPQKQLDKALKAEQVAIQRRKTAEAGLQACKLAERAAAEAERQAVARATAAVKREAAARLGELNAQTLAALTRILDELNKLGRDYETVRGLIGREAGAFPLSWGPMQNAMTGIARTVEVLEPIAHRAQQQGEPRD
jgi:regulator of protease activity HflC (stomatin/prohibitin superfamily)